MSAIVADTHSLIWALRRPDRLSEPARAAFNEAAAQGQPTYVSAVSLIEIRYLVEKRKLEEQDFAFVKNALDDPDRGLVLIPVDLSICLRLGDIPREVVPDMPDRIIATTAKLLDVPLVTRDQRIRQADLVTIW